MAMTGKQWTDLLAGGGLGLMSGNPFEALTGIGLGALLGGMGGKKGQSQQPLQAALPQLDPISQFTDTASRSFPKGTPDAPWSDANAAMLHPNQSVSDLAKLAPGPSAAVPSDLGKALQGGSVSGPGGLDSAMLKTLDKQAPSQVADTLGGVGGKAAAGGAGGAAGAAAGGLGGAMSAAMPYLAALQMLHGAAEKRNAEKTPQYKGSGFSVG